MNERMERRSKYILTKIGKRKELMVDGVMAMDDHDDHGATSGRRL